MWECLTGKSLANYFGEWLRFCQIKTIQTSHAQVVLYYVAISLYINSPNFLSNDSSNQFHQTYQLYSDCRVEIWGRGYFLSIQFHDCYCLWNIIKFLRIIFWDWNKNAKTVILLFLLFQKTSHCIHGSNLFKRYALSVDNKHNTNTSYYRIVAFMVLTDLKARENQS